MMLGCSRPLQRFSWCLSCRLRTFQPLSIGQESFHYTTKKRNERIAVAMSGGVDSSVAALLLQQQGYDCVGVFMRNWDRLDEDETSCSIDDDWLHMRKVCARLNIPAIEVDFVKEYWTLVFEPFLRAYESNQATPNPDALCNRFVKFGCLQQYVQQRLGIQRIATGHYARLDCSDDASIAVDTTLRSGVDPLKDQSYFLCMTKAEDLKNVLFPLGNMLKSRVRQIAQQQLSGLKVANKKESMGLCFVGKRDMSQFLNQYIRLTPGRFVDIDSGLVVGAHHGSELFTVGQKARIGGVASKYYVAGKQSLSSSSLPGDVIVADRSDHPALYCSTVQVDASQVNWLIPVPTALTPVEVNTATTTSAETTTRSVETGDDDENVQLHCRIRHGQTLQPCTVRLVNNSQNRYNDTISNNNKSDSTPNNVRLEVVFESPQRGVVPGQVIALYRDDVCVAGAVM